MTISHNPSKTLTIEKKWLREVRKKYASLQRDIRDKLKELSGPIKTNATLGLDSSQQRTFMSWLEIRIQEVTGDSPPNNWQNKYQLESYMRAIERTRQSLISQGASLELTDAERFAAQGLPVFSATPSLGSASVAATIHQDALEFLFTRSYTSLKGWNDAFIKEVRQITFDAVKNGDGIRETTKKIAERTKVTRSRAELIARTETIQAYQTSTINETERAAQELDEEVNLRWITALDSRVRHLHANWHGSIASPKDTNRKIGISPFNCRCAQVPVIEGINDTPEKNAKFAEQKKQMVKLEEKP